MFVFGRAWVSDPAAARSENVALPPSDALCAAGRANRPGEPPDWVPRSMLDVRCWMFVFGRAATRSFQDKPQIEKLLTLNV